MGTGDIQNEEVPAQNAGEPALLNQEKNKDGKGAEAASVEKPGFFGQASAVSWQKCQ